MHDCILHFILNLRGLPSPPPPPPPPQWTALKSSLQDEVYFMDGGAAGGL